MIRYKIDVGDALERAGFNSYKARTSGLLGQATLKKIKDDDTNISLKSLNNICLILGMQPQHIIEFVPTEEEQENSFFKDQ